MAYATARQQGADILIVCEPNKKRVNDNWWLKDTKMSVALLLLNGGLAVVDHSVGDGHLVLRLRGFSIVCCWWLKDTKMSVALLLLNGGLAVVDHSVGDGHLVLRLRGFSIVCCCGGPQYQHDGLPTCCRQYNGTAAGRRDSGSRRHKC
ncbi:hypothetical protein QE152_g38879 [Popillia japonica]|uniref:Uncharacterized protein n=1 Tax=Popillia japonica TaxID=7064 RepID=A0AAW1HVP5_POPJA